ncbi:MAG: PEP-CTERM sorting domain-containing protein [Burkholderiales bacterium]|nr:PEP-CTERM sorting domain-containing protein [Burkholderiales bacterium]
MKRTLLALAALAFSAQAFSATVAPVSYDFSEPTACGSWCYHDAARTKLTDGIVGNAGWAVNQGQEWAGWVYQNAVNVDFAFNGNQHINSVSIGSTQDSLGDVALPSFSVFAKEGGNWVLKATLDNPASSGNDHSPWDNGSHPFYTLDNLNIYSNEVLVTATAHGPWIFMDEVRFTSAVPEPETYGMMLAGLGALGFIARRRKK